MKGVISVIQLHVHFLSLGFSITITLLFFEIPSFVRLGLARLLSSLLMYFLPSTAFRLICFLKFKGDSVLQGLLSDSIIEDSAWMWFDLLIVLIG